VIPSGGLGTVGVLGENRAPSRPRRAQGPAAALLSGRCLQLQAASLSKTFASPGGFCSLGSGQEGGRQRGALQQRRGSLLLLQAGSRFTSQRFESTAKPCSLHKPKNPPNSAGVSAYRQRKALPRKLSKLRNSRILLFQTHCSLKCTSSSK